MERTKIKQTRSVSNKFNFSAKTRFAQLIVAAIRTTPFFLYCCSIYGKALNDRSKQSASCVNKNTSGAYYEQ